MKKAISLAVNYADGSQDIIDISRLQLLGTPVSNVDTTNLPLVKYRGKSGQIHDYYLHGYEGSRVRLQHIAHETTFLGLPENIIGGKSTPQLEPEPEDFLQPEEPEGFPDDDRDIPF